MDTTSTRDNEYTVGVLTGQTITSSRTGTGGAASLTNDGWIGYDGGAAFDGDDASVSVFSATQASALNNGQIFGSIGAFSIYEDASTTTLTDIGDVTQVNTTTTTYSATGGSATVTNNGRPGDASLVAIDGTLTNNGVLRGDVSVGANVDNYTTRAVDTLTQLGEKKCSISPM